MKTRKSTTNLFILILIICLFSESACNSNRVNEVPPIQDSSNILDTDYYRFLQSYKHDNLTNDTILLGFQIGMPASNLKAHLKKLISIGAIVNKNHKLYALIPFNERCTDDKDSVHQFIAELVFYLNDSDSTLNTIYATLYGPRFYIVPVKQRASEKLMLRNPMYRLYKKTVGDSFFNATSEKIKTPDFYTPLIEHYLLKGGIVKNYQLKYGSETRTISEDSKNVHLWITQGRVIVLSLRNAFYDIAKDYLNRTMPVSKSEFTGMVQIGELRYSSITNEILSQEKMGKAASSLKGYMDSTYKNEEEDRERKEREKVNESGI
jgi:hypothetical protein